ncbi:MAG: zf-HC2 domain-containing protein [Candidatus Omnitrophota bacterium]
MNHDTIQKKLMEYYDGELDPAGCRLIEEHLVGCPECRSLLKAWRDTASAVFKKSRIPDSEFFVQSVMARVRRPVPVRRASPWSIPVGWLTPAIGVAAMLLLMLMPVPNAPFSMETFLLSKQDISAAVLSGDNITSDQMMEFVIGG